MRAACFALLVGVSPALAQDPPRAPAEVARAQATYEDAIMRVVIDRGTSSILPALTYDTTVLLPLRQFAELAELRLDAFALRDSAAVLLMPGALRLLFRPGTRLVSRNGVSVPYDTLDVTWWDGDLFVATGLLDRLLGVSTSIAWTDLSLLVAQSAGLPVVQRQRRELRRQRMGQSRAEPDMLDVTLRPRVVDGAVASWQLTAARRGPSEDVSLELGLGGELLGGSAEVRPVLWSAGGMGDAEVRLSWWKAWAGDNDVRQLRIGDGQTFGRRAWLFQGVALTNAPYIRSSEFDVEQLVRDVPRGWEIELYERGQLRAFADAATVGAFRTPLQLGYGHNPFELVMYGPGGETVRHTRTIRIPFSRLPGGRFEYAAALGRCRSEPCDALVSADARYGLSSHVTVQGGWDALFDDARTPLWQPYVLVSGAATQALALTGEAVANGHLRAAADYEPTLDLRLSAAHTRFSASGVLTPGGLTEASRSEASMFWHPHWRRGDWYFQGNAVFTGGPVVDRRLLRLSASTRRGSWRYGLGLLNDRADVGSIRGAGRFAMDASIDGALTGPWAWLRSSVVQGQLALEPARGLTALRTMLSQRLGPALRLDAGVGWIRDAGASLELALVSATPGPRFGMRTRTGGTGSQAMVYSSGSMALDPRTRLVRFSDATDLGRTGVAGVLFRDDNSNGVQDDGETGIADIPVRVGGWPARTDSGGRFAAWGMMVTEQVRIDVDTLALANPQLVLPAAVLRVRPSPNTFGTVAVPVVVGAEVSGFVTLGEEPVPGVPVLLRELDTEAIIATLTYQDGGFYRTAVPPGEYEIVVDESALERLGAVQSPVHILVPPGRGEKRFDDLRIRLERAP